MHPIFVVREFMIQFYTPSYKNKPIQDIEMVESV